MSGRFFYLLSFLPSLPDFGGEPRLSPGDLVETFKTQPEPALHLLAEVVEVERALTAVVAALCLKRELPAQVLPEELRVALPTPEQLENGLGEDVWVTDVWTAFYAWLEAMARRIGSPLLRQWSRLEYVLRGALADARLEAFAEDGSGPAAGATVVDFPIDDDLRPRPTEVVQAWRSEADPMRGEMLLDKARHQWITHMEPTYTFDIDELVAYVLKLRLLTRHAQWSRDEGLKILGEVTAL